MTRKLTLVLICALSVASAVYAANGADIARRAQDADKYVSYRGLKTACVCLEGRCITSAIKVVHMIPDLTRKEYFSPAALAGIIVIQDGLDVWRYAPRERVWEQVHSAANAPAEPSSSRAFANYDVQLVGNETVAGREAFVIRAVPRHIGDALHKMWVDRNSYLMLQTQVESVSGAVLSSSKFNTIEINPRDISPKAFAIKGKPKAEPVPGRADFRVAKPSYLPRGYRLTGLAMVSVNHRSCAHLQFSNGVNTISLFERKSGDTADAPRVPDKLTTVMTWAHSGMLFTLVGDVSRAELKKIADSTK